MAAFSIIRLLPLLALVFFCLEVASVILVGQRVGVFTTLLLIFADFVLGVSVIRTAGANAVNEVRMPLRSPGFEARLAGGMALRVLAGLLFIIPGFFSDVLALLILVTPIQRWLSRRFKPAPAEQYMHRASRNQEASAQHLKIIEGEVIEIGGEIDTPGSSGPGQADNRN